MVILGRRVALWLLPVLLILFVHSAWTQGVPQFAGQSSSSASVASPLLTSHDRFGLPGIAYGAGGSDFIPLSSDMLRGILPRIPNLELGFLYNIGSKLRSGRIYADYLLPYGLGCDSVLFGEAHAEFQDFWKKTQVATAAGPGITVTTSWLNNRTDLSFGGGYRKVIGNRGFIGINAFYDSTKLYGKWYSSGGAGLEMVALTAGNGALDLNFNWYGNLINRSELLNAFRNRAGSWDIEAGISQPLFSQSLDLRLSGTAYDFNIGTAVYGLRTGAELTTRNGYFTLKYEYGHDRVNGSYNTVGGYVNVGLQLENVVRGESPFTHPEPVFGSPRNLRRLLSQKVRRNWHQPAMLVLARSHEIIATLPSFRMTISGNLIGTSTFDPDSAVWSLDTFGAQPNAGCIAIFGPGGAVRAAGYTVSLVGDTSRLTFPLTFTLTPIPDGGPGHGLVGILVNNFPGGGCVAGSLDAPLTATLATPTSVFSSSGFAFGRPIVFVKNPLPAPGVNIGTFIITADSPNDALVAPLMVQIVAGP